MAITPAIWLPVVAGRNRADVDEALASPIIRSSGLLASDEFYAQHGAQHPLGAGFTGAQDYLPQEMDERTALDRTGEVPLGVVRDIGLCGTPDEIIDRAAQWRDAGVRHIVLVNYGPMQRSMRKGLASSLPFTQVVRRLKKL